MTAVADEFGRLDLIDQAALVRRGEATPLELVDAAIERIEAVNPRLNAVVLPLFDSARARPRQPISRTARFAGCRSS